MKWIHLLPTEHPILAEAAFVIEVVERLYFA